MRIVTNISSPPLYSDTAMAVSVPPASWGPTSTAAKARGFIAETIEHVHPGHGIGKTLRQRNPKGIEGSILAVIFPGS